MATERIDIDIEVPAGKRISHVNYEVPMRGNHDEVTLHVKFVDDWHEPTNKDIGTMVFVRNRTSERWIERRLLWVKDLPDGMKFIVLNPDETVDFYFYAQISKGSKDS